MVDYKLMYFDARGRAELARYVLVVAGVRFDDHRIQRDNWPEIKTTLPFGQIPVLEVGGKFLAQSMTIVRYLAREFGLAGKTSWEEALVDQYIELLDDLYKEVRNMILEPDEDKKKYLQNSVFEITVPKYLGIFEKELTSCGEYLVGNSLTAADLALYCNFDTPLQIKTTLFDSYPNLQAHRSRVEALPRLGEYVKHRQRYDI